MDTATAELSSVVDRKDRAVAAAAMVDPDAWLDLFEDGFARIAGRFKRAEPRWAAHDWLLGLLSDVDTRSCWQLAEQAGHASPHPMQRLRPRQCGTPTLYVTTCVRWSWPSSALRTVCSSSMTRT